MASYSGLKYLLPGKCQYAIIFFVNTGVPLSIKEFQKTHCLLTNYFFDNTLLVMNVLDGRR